MTAEPTYTFIRSDPDNFRSYYRTWQGKVFCIARHKPSSDLCRFYECTDDGELMFARPQFPQDHEFDRKVLP